MTSPGTLDPRDLWGPALRTFHRLAEAWSLSKNEQQDLLGLPNDAFVSIEEWGESSRPSTPVLERVGHLIGIYGALHTIFADDVRADAWVRRPQLEGPLAGSTALERMREGGLEGLHQVHAYLKDQLV